MAGAPMGPGHELGENPGPQENSYTRGRRSVSTKMANLATRLASSVTSVTFFGYSMRLMMLNIGM